MTRRKTLRIWVSSTAVLLRGGPHDQHGRGHLALVRDPIKARNQVQLKKRPLRSSSTLSPLHDQREVADFISNGLRAWKRKIFQKKKQTGINKK
jgi:hypothetical protein